MWKCSIMRWKANIILTVLFIVEQTVCQEYSPEDGTAGVKSGDVSVIFDDNNVIVNPGDRLPLNCGVNGDYRHCYWEKVHPDPSQTTKLIQVEDVHDKLIEGMSAPDSFTDNQCGIVINSVTNQDHGMWMCKILVIGSALSRKKNITVTITPTSPLLEVPQHPMVVMADEVQVIKCSVAAARPQVKIHWWLSGTEITSSSTSEHTPTTNDGTYKTISTLTRKFQPGDDAKKLICSVEHSTLKEPKTAVVGMNVQFKPIQKDITVFYQIPLNTDYKVVFNFSANPTPKSLQWSYGDSPDNILDTIPVPGKDLGGRYVADNYEKLENGQYMAVLRILEFTKEDADHFFKLSVENVLGITDYQIRLSMDEAPAESLGSGAVAAIVIVVILVVAAVVIAGYMKYNQMYCFAPPAKEENDEEKETKRKEEQSDTESARAPTTNRCQVILKNINKNVTSIKKQFNKSMSKEDTKMNQMEEGTADKETENADKADKPDVSDKPDKPDTNTDEVVYAELDLGKGEVEKMTDDKTEEKTEYAQIVGTIVDNKVEERKE